MGCGASFSCLLSVYPVFPATQCLGVLIRNYFLAGVQAVEDGSDCLEAFNPRDAEALLPRVFKGCVHEVGSHIVQYHEAVMK